MQTMIDRLETAKLSSGNGYYTVYMLEDVVIKRYASSGKYRDDVKKHSDLDVYNLLPKMIASFENDGYYYLVVEKIQEVVPYDGLKKNYDYFEAVYANSTSDIYDGINDYKQEICGHGYSLLDDHAGNFGFKNGKLICLDEGCLC